MVEGVLALQTTKVIRRSAFRKAIWVARWYVKGVQNAATINEIWHHLFELSFDALGQLLKGTAKPMPPNLLTVLQMQRLEGLFRSLMTREAGPLVVSSRGAQLSQTPVRLSLLKPVRRAVQTRTDTALFSASRKPRTTATMASSTTKRRSDSYPSCIRADT